MFIPEMIDKELPVFIFLEDLVNDNKMKNVNTPQECLFHNHMTNSRKSKT